MLGAIAGDIIGSVYEFNNQRSKDFPLFTEESTFTDDSILTVAVADVILHGGSYTQAFKTYYQRYPNPTGSYGMRFAEWARSPQSEPYNSFGNGSAMRVSPVGFAFNTLDTVLQQAKASAEVTHNHPEGIKGAQVTAACIFLARTGISRDAIRSYVETTFGYNLGRSLDEIRPHYTFDESCQGTVPEAIIAALDSTDFEDAIRNAVSLGGDSDTLTCITGSIAEALYGGVPDAISTQVLNILDQPLKTVTEKFLTHRRMTNLIT